MIKKGIYAAGLSILNDDYSLDVNATIGHAEEAIQKGLHGVFFFGSTGQSQLISISEKKDLISKEISRTISIKPQIDNGDILPGDSTGKSISNSISYFFDNDDQIMIDCSDWSDAVSYGDNLKVILLPNYINRWILDEAFN